MVYLSRFGWLSWWMYANMSWSHGFYGIGHDSAIFATSENQNWPSGIDRSWVVCCNFMREHLPNFNGNWTSCQLVLGEIICKLPKNIRERLGFESSKWVFLRCVQNLWKQVCMSAYGRVYLKKILSNPNICKAATCPQRFANQAKIE